MTPPETVNTALGCEHCRAVMPVEADVVQLDFPDRAPLVFCGFKCLHNWARNQVESGAFRTLTHYQEPRA